MSLSKLWQNTTCVCVCVWRFEILCCSFGLWNKWNGYFWTWFQPELGRPFATDFPDSILIVFTVYWVVSRKGNFSIYVKETNVRGNLYIYTYTTYPSAANTLWGSVFRYPFFPHSKTTTAEGSQQLASLHQASTPCQGNVFVPGDHIMLEDARDDEFTFAFKISATIYKIHHIRPM